MLDKIIGSKVAPLILFQIYHYGECYAGGISKDLGISLSQIQKQLLRFEDAGVLVSKKLGNTRIYFFNKKYPPTMAFMHLIEIYYSSLSGEDKKRLFKARYRPRKPGKQIIR